METKVIRITEKDYRRLQKRTKPIEGSVGKTLTIILDRIDKLDKKKKQKK